MTFLNTLDTSETGYTSTRDEFLEKIFMGDNGVHVRLFSNSACLYLSYEKYRSISKLSMAYDNYVTFIDPNEV